MRLITLQRIQGKAKKILTFLTTYSTFNLTPSCAIQEPLGRRALFQENQTKLWSWDILFSTRLRRNHKRRFGWCLIANLIFTVIHKKDKRSWAVYHLSCDAKSNLIILYFRFQDHIENNLLTIRSETWNSTIGYFQNWAGGVLQKMEKIALISLKTHFIDQSKNLLGWTLKILSNCSKIKTLLITGGTALLWQRSF